MKRYKLLKDVPTFKAGDLFYLSKDGDLKYEGLNYKENADSALLYGSLSDTGIVAYAKQTLEKFPKILTEWFEEIKEPIDSIHWKPRYDDGEYWIVNSYGLIVKRIWSDSIEDLNMYKLGFIYPTEEKCKKDRNRKLAEVRLRRTSTFEPDFENNNSGYVVYYDFRDNKLDICSTACCSYGERVHYKTKEEAEKSIKENEQDWKIYFGIKEEE